MAEQVHFSINEINTVIMGWGLDRGYSMEKIATMSNAVLPCLRPGRWTPRHFKALFEVLDGWTPEGSHGYMIGPE